MMTMIGFTLAMSGFALLMTGNSAGGVALLVPGLVFWIAGMTAARKAAAPGGTPDTTSATDQNRGTGEPGTGR